MQAGRPHHKNMASAFDALMAAATPQFQAAFMETITYSPNGGTPRSIKAVVQREMRQQEMDEFGRNFYNSMPIEIPNDDAADGVTTPNELRNGGDMDTFTIDGKVWLLQRVMGRNVAGVHQLKLFDRGVA